MVHVKNSAKCLEKDYQTLNIIYLSYKVSESYIFLFIHSFIQFKVQFCLSIQCKRMDLSFQEKKNNLKSDLWFQRYNANTGSRFFGKPCTVEYAWGGFVGWGVQSHFM